MVSQLLWTMGFHLHSNMFCFFAFFLLFGGGAFGQLSSNYYATTCPRALSTIRTAVNNAVSKEHRMGASLLRLHFHDCFINACSLAPSLFPSLSCTRIYTEPYMHMHSATIWWSYTHAHTNTHMHMHAYNLTWYSNTLYSMILYIKNMQFLLACPIYISINA